MKKCFFVFTALLLFLVKNNISAKPSVERGEYLGAGLQPVVPVTHQWGH
ncbi:MAG: hypothetical protein Ct9H300mP28_22730 [Pseudomonadota bacterium]|nr:MAG: hypothetical protein Ct9H300mP28_22730 [Pseudomonadota bacterium]